jgi:hypothetical protein
MLVTKWALWSQHALRRYSCSLTDMKKVNRPKLLSAELLNVYFRLVNICLLAYFPYFEKNKSGLMRSPCCRWLCIPTINFWTPEPIFMKLCIYIMTPVPISTVYFINLSHQSVYPTMVTRQRLGKDVTAATNTHAAIEELLDTSFSIQSVYQRKAGD